MTIEHNYPEGSVGAYFVELLVSNGMWPKEAETVLEEVKTLPEMQAMKWNDQRSVYPDGFCRITVWDTVKGEAIKWLETYRPAHFALGVLKAA